MSTRYKSTGEKSKRLIAFVHGLLWLARNRSFKKNTIRFFTGMIRFFQLNFYFLASPSNFIIKDILGNKMILDLNDRGISRDLLFEGMREERALTEIRKILIPGMRVAELGANIGYYALIEAQIVGENGRIYAFEPNPHPRHLLEINILLNHFENRIEVFPYALSDKEGRFPFFLSEHSNLGNMVENLGDVFYRGTDKMIVETKTLDSFFKNKHIDFMRMDVEGFEINIIKGAKRFLKDMKPTYLFIEIHPRKLIDLGSNVTQFLDLMDNLGYDVLSAFCRGSTRMESKQELLSYGNGHIYASHTFFKKRN